MSVVNLGRTTRTNMVFYSTDGNGRDGYITYNDGGFWKENIKQISLKPDYPRNNKKNFYSLFHQAAPFNYQSDGSGRDSYVIEHNGGLVKPFEPLIKQKLIKFLRKDNSEYIKRKIFLTKSQKKFLNKIKNIQKNVVNRLYNDSLDRIRKNKMKLNTKSLSGFFDETINRKNLDSISPIKNYKDKDYSLKNNKKFLNPLKEQNQKNFFNIILKNRNIHKNNSMKNLSYFDKNDNTSKVKILKNLKFNSYFNDISSNNLYNKINNKGINFSNNYKNENLKKKFLLKNKKYNVVVGPKNLKMKNNLNINYNSYVNSIYDNNINEQNNFCYNDNEKRKNIEQYESNKYVKLKDKTNKNDFCNEFNKTQLLSKSKPFLVYNYKNYKSNYENYLKK